METSCARFAERRQNATSQQIRSLSHSVRRAISIGKAEEDCAWREVGAFWQERNEKYGVKLSKRQKTTQGLGLSKIGDFTRESKNFPLYNYLFSLTSHLSGRLKLQLI
jgi:hypothetical protein